MSILAAADAATQPTPGEQLAFAAVMLIVAVGLGIPAGVFRRGSIRGPERLAPDAPRGAVFVVLSAGVLVWLAVQMVIGISRRAQHEASGTTQPFDLSAFTAADYALLATIPGLIGLVVILAGDVLVGRDVLRRLGLSMRQFLPGVLKGVVGIFILMPLIFFASAVAEWIYRRIGYQHPSEHDLLRVMNEAADPTHRVLLIVGATLVAPAFEEFVFRGHLQTLMTTWIDDFLRYFRAPEPAPAAAPAFEVVTDVPVPVQALPAAAEEVPQLPPDLPVPVKRSTTGLWVAVVITSILFASIHASWSVPLVFLLSLGLGYAYERTGNLWVPLTIHLLFNTFQTALFLLLKAQN